MRTDEAKTLAIIVFDVVLFFVWLITTSLIAWRRERRHLKEIKADVERLSERLGFEPEKELPPVKDGRYR